MLDGKTNGRTLVFEMCHVMCHVFSLFTENVASLTLTYSKKIRVFQWSGRLDSNQRPTVPKIVPERFIDSQELHKPCKLGYIPFMLCIGNHQLHNHVLPLSYLLC